MAEEEFIELGIEGITRLSDKYHDKAWDALPSWKKRQVREKDRQDRQDREDHRERARSNPPKYRQDDDYRYGDSRLQYSNERALVRSGDRADYRDSYPANPNDRGYSQDLYKYESRESGYGALQSTRDARHATYYPGGAPPSSSMRNPYPADSIIVERDRYRARSKSRSRSRSRRDRRRSEAQRAPENEKAQPYEPKHRFTPILIGAAAGGLAGRNISDGDGLTTVASAIVGAMGTKYGYKQIAKYEHGKHKKEDREWREDHRNNDDDYDDRSRYQGGRGGKINFSRSESR